jgi:hypothetical protein
MALIPTKNPAALIGYYLGVATLIPGFGLITALPAIICGVIGLVQSNKDPSIGGGGHAITAIILGIVGQLLWVGLIVILAGR